MHIGQRRLLMFFSQQRGEAGIRGWGSSQSQHRILQRSSVEDGDGGWTPNPTNQPTCWLLLPTGSPFQALQFSATTSLQVTHDYVTSRVSRSLPDPGLSFVVVLMLPLIAQFPTGNRRMAKTTWGFYVRATLSWCRLPSSTYTATPGGPNMA